jgi:hypothetical protein
MPAWFSWLLLAVLLVLPVALAFVGDEPPDNSITHESGGSRDGSQDDDPDGLLLAA